MACGHAKWHLAGLIIQTIGHFESQHLLLYDDCWKFTSMTLMLSHVWSSPWENNDQEKRLGQDFTIVDSLQYNLLTFICTSFYMAADQLANHQIHQCSDLLSSKQTCKQNFSSVHCLLPYVMHFLMIRAYHGHLSCRSNISRSGRRCSLFVCS